MALAKQICPAIDEIGLTGDHGSVSRNQESSHGGVVGWLHQSPTRVLGEVSLNDGVGLIAENLPERLGVLGARGEGIDS